MSKLVKKYKVKLLGKQVIANDTYSLYFSKPKNFVFKAGQFVKVELDEEMKDDDKSGLRYFTISSPPLSDMVAISFRMTYSDFKEKLLNLNIGDELYIEGPYGDIAFTDDAKDGLVFLTAGIGISTAHSYILDLLQREQQIPVWLFLSNHTTMDTPWYRCLSNLHSPKLKIIFTMTRAHEELVPWAGNIDHINLYMIKKYITHLRKKKYVILGRDAFVEQMKTKLLIMGIPQENIRSRVYVY